MPELADRDRLAELQAVLESVPRATRRFAPKDVAHNNAVVPREELTRRCAALKPREERRTAPKKAGPVPRQSSESRRSPRVSAG